MPSAALPAEILWIEPLSPSFPHSCNAYAVWEGDGTWTWIDPGAAGDENLARTETELARLGLPLAKLGRILVTHPHVDHLSAAGALAARGVRVPVHCHPDAVACARDLATLIASFDFDVALARLPDERERTEAVLERMRTMIFAMHAPFVATDPLPTLHDGAVIATGPFEWRCLHTPGHAPGHVAFHEHRQGLLVSGDLVGPTLAWHSPSSGGAAGYLASLERLQALDLRVLLPSHGEPNLEPTSHITKMLKRLVDRESRLLDVLARGTRRYASLYDEVNADPDHIRLFPLAPMLEGHLERLAALGEIVEDDGVFSRT
ncbi:MAG: MBL fold metallo-hydrolase [bacterium]